MLKFKLNTPEYILVTLFLGLALVVVVMTAFVKIGIEPNIIPHPQLLYQITMFSLVSVYYLCLFFVAFNVFLGKSRQEMQECLAVLFLFGMPYLLVIGCYNFRESFLKWNYLENGLLGAWVAIALLYIFILIQEAKDKKQITN